jgi:hypothetical protein
MQLKIPLRYKVCTAQFFVDQNYVRLLAQNLKGLSYMVRNLLLNLNRIGWELSDFFCEKGSLTASLLDVYWLFCQIFWGASKSHSIAGCRLRICYDLWGYYRFWRARVWFNTNAWYCSTIDYGQLTKSYRISGCGPTNVSDGRILSNPTLKRDPSEVPNSDFLHSHQRPNRTELYWFGIGSVRLRLFKSSSGSVRFGSIFKK